MKREEFTNFLTARGVDPKSAAHAWRVHRRALRRATVEAFDRALAEACRALAQMRKRPAR